MLCCVYLTNIPFVQKYKITPKYFIYFPKPPNSALMSKRSRKRSKSKQEDDEMEPPSKKRKISKKKQSNEEKYEVGIAEIKALELEKEKAVSKLERKHEKEMNKLIDKFDIKLSKLREKVMKYKEEESMICSVCYGERCLDEVCYNDECGVGLHADCGTQCWVCQESFCENCANGEGMEKCCGNLFCYQSECIGQHKYHNCLKDGW